MLSQMFSRTVSAPCLVIIIIFFFYWTCCCEFFFFSFFSQTFQSNFPVLSPVQDCCFNIRRQEVEVLYEQSIRTTQGKMNAEKLCNLQLNESSVCKCLYFGEVYACTFTCVYRILSRLLFFAISRSFSGFCVYFIKRFARAEFLLTECHEVSYFQRWQISCLQQISLINQMLFFDIVLKWAR